MSRSTIHISVPEATRSYVEGRVAAAGYGSLSEYIRELIRQDRLVQARIAAREDLDEGDRNGRSVRESFIRARR